MKILSCNINGVFNAVQHGFFDWLTWERPDVACLQEINASSLPRPVLMWAERLGYEIALSSSVRGGTAILSRHGFQHIARSDGILASRGQITIAQIAGITVASVYVCLRSTVRERSAFTRHFEEIRSMGPAVIAGDFNIIARPGIESAIKYGPSAIGCAVDEREWLLRLLDSWTDVLPECYQQRPLYTFWVRHRKDELFHANRGTRLDYILASPDLATNLVRDSGCLFRQLYHGRRITDHGPISVEFKHTAHNTVEEPEAAS